MNITDQELKIINRVARTLSPIFTFSYYDREDIEQEVRLMCIQFIDKNGKIEEISLYNLLFTHCRNGLIDIRRAKSSKTVNPCLYCKHNKGGICDKHKGLIDCKKYQRLLLNNRKKHDLSNVYDTSDEPFEVVDLGAELDKKTIWEEIDRAIPPDLRHDYIRYLDGISLPYYNKQIILKTIRNIAVEKGILNEEG